MESIPGAELNTNPPGRRGGRLLKNVLHWRGIDRSILDINSTMPVRFVIADGIVAMEGNGPLLERRKI